MDSELVAINRLMMTTRESVRRTFDFSQSILQKEKIVGVNSVTLEPTGGPVVSEIGYSRDGKTVSFTLTATDGTTIARQYTVKVLASVLSEGLSQVVEGNGVLVVLP